MKDFKRQIWPEPRPELITITHLNEQSFKEINIIKGGTFNHDMLPDNEIRETRFFLLHSPVLLQALSQTACVQIKSITYLLRVFGQVTLISASVFLSVKGNHNGTYCYCVDVKIKRANTLSGASEDTGPREALGKC